ncbi:response regulator [Aureivirga marina]|uniref:response regulator n=1 Tax=Aureivirga marina TaxID=1182451 RepID=UPI0018CA3B78|nr:response regulator transcription factor [Aureivirga marina]
MIKVFLVDDHEIVLNGLKIMLKEEKKLSIIDIAFNGRELLEKLNEKKPDIVLMDITMPILDGIETSKILKKEFPKLKILILTTYTDEKTVKKMLKVGVDGYILKDSSRETILQAILKLMKGESYYDFRITQTVMNSFQQKKKENSEIDLTKREKEIVSLIANGKHTNEIAEKLFLSPLTVESHRKNIYLKLGINNIALLTRYAIERDLI